MKFKLLIVTSLIISAVNATRLWSDREIKRFEHSLSQTRYPRPETLLSGPHRFNYLQRIKWVCDFIVRHQVTDSSSLDYGGIIEAEHLPTIIETDNTQEAIWVWTRWYQLTDRNDYHQNISRAWSYLLGHPAYHEHGGNPSHIWYAVWNCGLGLWMELLYRQVYHDTSFKFYADSCRNFYLSHQLNMANYLDVFVTAQASGMVYDYALISNDQELLDTALARGIRVKSWIEAAPRSRLSYQSWAMSGATAFWGVAHTFCRADTVAGKIWVNTYAESLPGFYPTGTWNCSHNLWLANAYRAAAVISHKPSYSAMHRYLTDTLIMLDTDCDGGIPATWTDPPTYDQTWTSAYLNFMGMDSLVVPVFEHDLAIFAFVFPRPDTVYMTGETIKLAAPVANVGKNVSLPETVRLYVSRQPVDSFIIDPLPFLTMDTLWFSNYTLETAGMIQITATLSGDDNPTNDTSDYFLKIYRRCRLNGRFLDSTTLQPVSAYVKGYLFNRATVWDSCYTDTLGSFSLNLIDSTFNIVVEPAIPYPRRSYPIIIRQDTTILFLISPAQVLIVNTDTSDSYRTYYTSALDSLNISWCYWSRNNQGPIPYNLVGRLKERTIIWFSGNATHQTIPNIDQDSLAQFLEHGGKLFLTGQNIAEELASSTFLEEVIGCRFDSSGWRGFLVMGVTNDTLGRYITGTSTAGGNGANNQNSRDIISPLLTSRKFLIYDTTTDFGAGLRRENHSGGRVIFLGFGFEAINRPASRPEYLTRVQFMNLILNWLFTGTGFDEQLTLSQDKRSWHVFPRIFSTSLYITTDRPVDLKMFDVTGRETAKIHTSAGSTIWHLPWLSSGVYFIKKDNSSVVTTVKLNK